MKTKKTQIKRKVNPQPEYRLLKKILTVTSVRESEYVEFLIKCPDVLVRL